MFSKDDYDDWKIRMQAHLEAQDDDIWYVIIDGPMRILKVSTTTSTTEDAYEMKEKCGYEWTDEDKRKVNLSNMAKYILYKTLDKNMFSKIKSCYTAKEIWEKLTQLCVGNDQTKENKLMIATQKFDSIKMRPRETMIDFDERFNSIVIELSTLRNTYRNREVVIKVMRALPREWNIKTMAMWESKDLNKIKMYDLFADLKAYEFEINSRNEKKSSMAAITKSLVTTKETLSLVAVKSLEQISDDAMSLFVKKCGHFKADYKTLKRDDKKPFDRRKKKDQTALLTVESKSKWVDSDSDESSSSESEDESVKFFMAYDIVVFDFTSDEFTRDDISVNKFELSMMGELTFFLVLQVRQLEAETFINQAKYTNDLLKKFGMEHFSAASTPMNSSSKLDKDEGGQDVVIVLNCCAQLLWIQQQLRDFGIQADDSHIFCDNTSDIAITYNPVLHSRTKHIDIRHHFIRDHVAQKYV
ncbi:uncharacterized protein LOC124917513 [Impatiens glandulifera]|uniref:uncharacterized protein LOC124917513 n=1 Tax=Impatiens glandulifera TaxID=253017 RepID=UPI001FB142A9|nr:uncharacterized protein LOC124917513 [Impatiens glandulifera]